VKFRRQYSIGSFILDFYSPEYKLGIEANGSHHYEDEVSKIDKMREKELSMVGVDILRFNDNEILKNIEGVCEAILEKLKKK
jgi:very-short-patch-repair endonuclease